MSTRALRGCAFAAIGVLLLSAADRARWLHQGRAPDDTSVASPRLASAPPSDGAAAMHGGAGALHAPPPASPPKVDGSIECALRQAVPLGRGVVLLTFGDSGVHSMLSNFVEHAVMASAPFMVGAVDMAAFELLAARRVAVYKTPLALRSGYTLDGSNAHASDSWQSFAKMRSGEVARVVALGYDVLHTDVDVVWLRNVREGTQLFKLFL